MCFDVWVCHNSGNSFRWNDFCSYVCWCWNTTHYLPSPYTSFSSNTPRNIFEDKTSRNAGIKHRWTVACWALEVLKNRGYEKYKKTHYNGQGSDLLFEAPLSLTSWNDKLRAEQLQADYFILCQEVDLAALEVVRCCCVAALDGFVICIIYRCYMLTQRTSSIFVQWTEGEWKLHGQENKP